MIARLTGEVVDKGLVSVILDVHGVGYNVSVPQTDLDELQISSTTTLHTYHAVRENSQELYGFLNANSKELFELLLGVSGVGPKVAMSIVSLGSADEVKQAIADGNVAYVQSANGVGKRGAEKVIVELKDKVGFVGRISSEQYSNGGDDASEALRSLGFSAQQASNALSKVDNSMSTEDRIKAALAELSS